MLRKHIEASKSFSWFSELGLGSKFARRVRLCDGISRAILTNILVEELKMTKIQSYLPRK